jgi:O-acetyl-ADP-ribose deacetylase (regulator of RNase III)
MTFHYVIKRKIKHTLSVIGLHVELVSWGGNMRVTINHTVLELQVGDITEMDTDAIVNAANASLQLGGGVAGAIRRKGGPAIQEECNKIGSTPVGSAVLTSGGRLKAKYVIHAVGPIYGEEHDDEKLKDATLHALLLADKMGVKSIAFPAISTGIFRFPKERCATIMLSTTRAYLEGYTNLERVVFCLFDRDAYEIFRASLTTLTANC